MRRCRPASQWHLTQMRPRCQHLTLRVARRPCIGWQTGWPPWVSRRGDGIHPASVLTPPDSSWSPQATTPGGGDLKPRGRCAEERRRSSRRQVSPKRYLASEGYPLLRPPPRVACHTRFFHEKVPASSLDIHKSVWGTQGEFNWSSQHLDDEVLRCGNGDGEGQTGRVGRRCGRLVGRR